MTTARIDLLNQKFLQIRLCAIWVVLASTQLGFRLAAFMWKPRSIFYPFDLLLWAFVGVFWLFRARGALMGLVFNVTPEKAQARRKALLVLLYIFCTGIISFGFAVCLLAVKSFGKFYLIPAVILGALTIVMMLPVMRGTKRLQDWFSIHANETLV
jgi:hypothetical protein